MNLPLVSVITPCYNGGKVMHRLLDSILSQTYSNIEFILVNDGSNDNSEIIWKSYEEKFKRRGIKYIYIYQKNQGLGGAINAGLKVFTGDYFCWPDIDDYLEDTSIEKKVCFLEKHKDFGSVSSDANIYDENDLNNPIGTAASWMKHKYDENQFKWMLLGQSLYCSGCHMVRSSSFFDVNPDRRIYPARRGQNNQLLLPLYYKYKRGFIDEPLYNYIIYKKSMSRLKIDFNDELERNLEYIKLMKYTISTIYMDNNCKHFCEACLKNIEWDCLSKLYVEYGMSIKFIHLYFKLKMYSTKKSREIKRILFSIQKRINRK